MLSHVVYLHHILWSQTPLERSLADRCRCTHQAGGDRGDCKHFYKGWALKRMNNKKIVLGYIP